MHPKVAQTNHISLVSAIQLGVTDQVSGTIFRKQIMSYGRWVNPNWWWDEELWMELNEEIADQMIDNFNRKTYGKRISVPRNHTGDVNANAGEVIKLEKGNGGLWAYLDIRDPKTVSDIENGLVFDVSMGFDWDYVDQKEGLHHGATLVHVALVTDPYLNNMDDFQKADKNALSKRFDEWAGTFGFDKTQPSIIMMSKNKVEELKHMHLSKIKNDKEYAVEVTYSDAAGEEQKVTIEPGAEIEVPTEAADAVTKQIADSVAPETNDEETDEEKAAREAKEAEEAEAAKKAEEEAEAKKKADEEAAAAAKTGTEETSDEDKAELARLRAKEASFEADKAYRDLLAKGKITPAQKDMFMEFAVSGFKTNITLSSDFKDNDGKVILAKGAATSVTAMLSAILEAGPQLVKFGEQGTGKGEDEKVELTADQEEKLTKMGFNVETFKKHLEKGTIKLNENEEIK